VSHFASLLLMLLPDCSTQPGDAARLREAFLVDRGLVFTSDEGLSQDLCKA
jgi:hypothetical protein